MNAENGASWRRGLAEQLHLCGPWTEALDLLVDGLRWCRNEPDPDFKSAGAADLAPGSAYAELVAARAKVAQRLFLPESRNPATQVILHAHLDATVVHELDYLVFLTSRLDIEPAARAWRLHRFQADLCWYEILLAAAEDRPAPDDTLTIVRDLDYLSARLDLPTPVTFVNERGALRQRLDSLRAALMQRRLAAHLLRAPAPARGALRCWQYRFRLSHLQSEAMGLAGVNVAPLVQARQQWVQAAENELHALTDVERAAVWRDLITCAQAEFDDAAALQQSLPSAKAARILTIVLEDLQALESSAALFNSDDQSPSSKTTNEKSSDAASFPNQSDEPWTVLARTRRMARIARRELQDRLLAERLERILGGWAAQWLENLNLLLILLLALLLGVETWIEHSRALTHGERHFFGWADLIICSFFLGKFTLEMALVTNRWLYFRRRWLVDFVAALPLGFLSHHLHLVAENAKGVEWLADLWFLRLPQLLRYAKLVQPVVRAARLLVFGMRLMDQMVRRYAGVLNRNIVFFSSEQDERPESRHRFLLTSLYAQYRQRGEEWIDGLTPRHRYQFLPIALEDVAARVSALSSELSEPKDEQITNGREVSVEAVVASLVEMSPDELTVQMGEPFVDSLDHLLRMLDAPMARRLPGVREVVAQRAKGPAHAAALAVNYMGHFIQYCLNVAYYWADLLGTISAPLFLDRLGGAIVGATARPAKRLLNLGITFLLLWMLVERLPVFQPIEWYMKKLQDLLGTPAIILGLVCWGFWMLGSWFRRIANQAVDFSERVVEAQFIAQTKSVKAQHRVDDSRLLAERVVAPELELRSLDDRPTTDAMDQPRVRPTLDAALQSSMTSRRDLEGRTPWQVFLGNPEMCFLTIVNHLYADYLDGPPFHRNDTKATTQLLGNLALDNLRRSSLVYLARDRKQLEMLDLNRSSASLFGGPFVWFHYITRMITQETAKLLVDYNRHAIPLARLACAPAAERELYRMWVSRRLQIPPEQVYIPAPVGHDDDQQVPAANVPASSVDQERNAQEFLETLNFTALDFLGNDPAREEEIHLNHGPQVMDLLRRDRKQNVRRAFRSLPLEQMPRGQRTINVFALYNRFAAQGRIAFLPVRALGWLAWGVVFLSRRVWEIIQEIRFPSVEATEVEPADSYAVALRKIHRMRKPAFMESLWLRCRCDVEYLGLPLPGVPFQSESVSLLERDLDYIGATRTERVYAERCRLEHQRRLEKIGRWLRELGWEFSTLHQYLTEYYPHLADRSAEVVRALTTAFIVDHRDCYTLGLAREVVTFVMETAARGENPPLPDDFPDPPTIRRAGWFRRAPKIPLWNNLFRFPAFAAYDSKQQQYISHYLQQHKGRLRGWVDFLLLHGSDDPTDVFRQRLRDVLRRTDLWSQQLVVLRCVQTLTILDLHHYCKMVWHLGGYDELQESAPRIALPGSAAANPTPRSMDDPREKIAPTFL